MSPYQIEVIDDEPHGCPPWVMKIAILGLLVMMALIVRMALGLGLAFAHFSSAPTFATYVVEHAVPEATIEAWLPQGVLLSEGQTWELGAADSQEFEHAEVMCDVSIKHGAEVLLETKVELRLLLNAQTWEREGFVAPLPEMRVRDGMHAVVQLGLFRVQESLGQRTSRKANVSIDVLLAAGEGENVFRVVQLDEVPPSLGSGFPGFSMLHLMLGFIHPSGEPPEEGILHQARASFSLDWEKLPGGKGDSNPPTASPGTRTNCEQYSFETKVVAGNGRDRGLSWSRSSSSSLRYTWNEKVW